MNCWHLVALDTNPPSTTSFSYATGSARALETLNQPGSLGGLLAFSVGLVGLL